VKTAILTVLDDAGHPVWEGSALEFARANEMTRDDVAEMVACLRGVPGEPPEPYVVGGGAAQLFYVHLADDDEALHCAYCDAKNFPEYLRCIACGEPRPALVGLDDALSVINFRPGMHA